MTTPDQIWIAGKPSEYGRYYPERVEAEGEHGGCGIEYVRRDPVVLAALPEVQELIRAAERNMLARHILALRNRQAVYRAKAEQHGKDAFAKGVSSEAHIAIWAEYEKVTHTAEAHDYMIAAIRGPKP